MTEALIARLLPNGQWKPQRISLDNLHKAVETFPFDFLHTQNPHVIHVWERGENGGLTKEVAVLRTSGTANREWVFVHNGETIKVSHAVDNNYRIRDL